MTRRKFLFSFPVAGLGSAAYARYVEPEWLRLSELEYALPGLRKPVRLLHISDLHASSVVSPGLIEQAIAVGVSTQPDLICVTGDFVTTNRGYERAWYVNLLRRLPAAAPTFATLGNHDGGIWAAAYGGHKTSAEVRFILRDSGIALLHNTAAIAGELQLIGVGDLWAGDVDAHAAFASARRAPTVVLAHNPDTKDELTHYPWHLMLSGHTHGGQVVVPFLGVNAAPVRDKRYVAGLNPWGDRQIHTSRGVGNAYGVRFNCRPEVTVLTLLSKL